MPHAGVAHLEVLRCRYEPRSCAGNVQVKAVVGARPHAEAAEGRRAPDAGADRDRSELIPVGEWGCDPAASRSRDDARGECGAKCSLGDPTSEQRSDASHVTEPGEFAEEV
jgi:hypothetical protein